MTFCCSRRALSNSVALPQRMSDNSLTLEPVRCSSKAARVCARLGRGGHGKGWEAVCVHALPAVWRWCSTHPLRHISCYGRPGRGGRHLPTALPRRQPAWAARACPGSCSCRPWRPHECSQTVRDELQGAAASGRPCGWAGSRSGPPVCRPPCWLAPCCIALLYHFLDSYARCVS